MVDRGKSFRLISSRNHCQRSSPSQISGTLRKRDIENNNTQMEISLPANVDMAAIIQICYILFVLIKYSRYIEIFKSWIHNFKSIESFLCSFFDSRNLLVDLIYGWPSLFPSASSATSFYWNFTPNSHHLYLAVQGFLCPEKMKVKLLDTKTRTWMESCTKS